jgi:hypothetical protein
VRIEIEVDVRDEDGQPSSKELDADSYEILDNGVLMVHHDGRVKHYSPGYWCTVEKDTLYPEERERLDRARALPKPRG